MRILALDHGTKRIGVAVSDETKTIAQPLEYIPAEPFAGFLGGSNNCFEKEIDLILVGLPRNLDGSYGPAAEKCRPSLARWADRHHRADQNVGRKADLGAGEPGFD